MNHRLKILRAAWLSFALLAGVGSGLAQPAANRHAPPQRSIWNGFERLDFVVAARPCVLLFPQVAAPGKPWIWRTEFFGVEPQVDLALLARGWHVAHIDAKDHYGGPKAMSWFGSFYAHVVSHYGLSPRVVLEGFSRGALYAFNFAAVHPTRVAALYLDAPVIDIRSWPGRDRSSKEWAGFMEAYGLSEESLPAFRGNPVDRIAYVKRGNIPILVVAGEADTIVPWAENGKILEQRYRELGGTIEVILKSGADHHPHSLKDPAPIVDFLLKQARF